jgi:hypothetical protein
MMLTQSNPVTEIDGVKYKNVAGRDWRLSSKTDGVQCVGVAAVEEGVAMINTNRPDDGTRTLTTGLFAVLVEGIKAGELDHLAV